MVDETPCLALPLMASGQAQKHVTFNEAVTALDALVQLSVLSRGLAAPPATAADGARYIVASGASGAWAGQAGRIAVADGAGWRLLEPKAGWTCYVADEPAAIVHDGAGWKDLPVASARTFGVNATADSANRLAVASPSSLFSHEGQGHRLTINKSAPADTASIVLQTGFAGRAEIGLAGSDAFSVRTSADGAAWRTAISTAPASGAVGIGLAAPAAPLHVAAEGNVRLLLQPAAGAGDRESFVDLAATFDNQADVNPRLCARLRGGFAGGAWGTEFLSLGVGGALTENDPPVERARLTADGLQVMGAVRPASHAKTALPSAAAAGAGAMIFVTNDAGGPVIAFSDGAAWRRVTDRAVVS